MKHPKGTASKECISHSKCVIFRGFCAELIGYAVVVRMNVTVFHRFFYLSQFIRSSNVCIA